MFRLENYEATVSNSSLRIFNWRDCLWQFMFDNIFIRNGYINEDYSETGMNQEP